MWPFVVTCVRVASWRVWDHTSRTDKAWVLVWSVLKRFSYVYWICWLFAAICRGRDIRQHCYVCGLSVAFCPLCALVVRLCCGQLVCTSTCSGRDRLSWCVVHLGYALHMYSVAFSSRKKGVLWQGPYFVLCVSQYLYVLASSVV